MSPENDNRAILGLRNIWQQFCYTGQDPETGKDKYLMSFRSFCRHRKQLFEEGAILRGQFGPHGRTVYYTYPSVWFAWILKRMEVRGSWPERS